MDLISREANNVLVSATGGGAGMLSRNRQIHQNTIENRRFAAMIFNHAVSEMDVNKTDPIQHKEGSSEEIAGGIGFGQLAK